MGKLRKLMRETPAGKADETKEEEKKRLKKEKNMRELLEEVKALHTLTASAILLPTASSIDNLTYNLSISPEREQGEYSDSDSDSEAPHFNGVYNHTKFYHEEDIVDNEKKIIDNYVSDYRLITNSKLEADAREIQQYSDHRNKNSTVLCMMLRQRDGRIKKFAFTNGESICETESEACTDRGVCQKAHEKGYHVIHAQKSHAEGEMIQFLQERPKRYTHIVAMGCDKPVCNYCDLMLKKVINLNCKEHFGLNIYNSSLNWWVPVALKDALGSYAPEKHFLSEKIVYNINKTPTKAERQRKLTENKWHERREKLRTTNARRRRRRSENSGATEAESQNNAISQTESGGRNDNSSQSTSNREEFEKEEKGEQEEKESSEGKAENPSPNPARRKLNFE